MVKDARVLHDAYNDAAGITQRFNKNVLARINRELGASFHLDKFRHVAFWSARKSRIEMHLESLADQSVSIPDLGRTLHFTCGERIHTENSYKFTPESIAFLVKQSGLKLERTWSDPRQWFSVVLVRA
jgi:uncharacterized SAM-dependent methyltransferase